MQVEYFKDLPLSSEVMKGIEELEFDVGCRRAVRKRQSSAGALLSKSPAVG